MAHTPAPAPELHAYWFYTSSLPIDDPLSPLPTTPSSSKLPPRPFSRYDSTALEAAYKDLLEERSASSTTRTNSRSPTPPRKRSASVASREAAVEGHPVLKGHSSEDVEVEARNEVGEIHSSSVPNKPRRSSSPLRNYFAPSSLPSAGPSNASAEPPSAGTTRNPFIRSLSLSRAATMPHPPPSQERSKHSTPSKTRAPSSPPASPPIQREIPVGIQRLHKVLLPSFVMTPIYWSPLHDTASVVRGTWFYKDTMLPVETEAANRLETGWQEVRAWTEEWDLELESAVAVGREGEEKVRWQLWDQNSLSRPGSRPESRNGMTMEGQGDNTMDPKPPATPKKDEPVVAVNDSPTKLKPNPWDWVLFANARDAYICRDTMLSFGNRRPLKNLRRGNTEIGTHVVRGFSEKEWLRLHPSRRRPAPPPRKRSATMMAGPPNAKEKAQRSYSATGSLMAPRQPLTEDFQAGGNVGQFREQQENGLGMGENEEERGKVTDLFLVIHGIGQKLSERVESFNFTHSINAFRRLINVELRNEAVRPHLRDDDVGIMVLPINWRSKLELDEGLGTNAPTDGSSDPERNNFALPDITPPSIPAVRNLIGDVMLDIPYYLSHHKQTMIRAVVKEANRVYNLWCQNNPGFEKEGRVHIIAHSLGSAIALDILSKQPTKVEPKIPVSSGSEWGTWGKKKARRERELALQEERFDFDTKNLFFCGSPAGFFLLLNRATLLPRKGRSKPGTAGEDMEPGVAGDAGKYGCLAVDNVYNILHYSDPIAYRLNPTVDAEYAKSLKTAYVPSTSSSLLDAFTSTIRSVFPGSNAAGVGGSSLPIHPHMTRLPSTMELETHNFSREEMAEKRLQLLNDNGQLDWYLTVMRPLENQYLNMLGAHSSYWESRDFARLCVVEAGRGFGEMGTLQGMRVVKKRAFMRR